MLNTKMIYRIMGFLILIETAMLLSSSESLYYQEDDLNSFSATTGITFITGNLLLLMGRNAEKVLASETDM